MLNRNNEKEYKKYEDSLRDLWDNIKYITFVLQEHREERRAKGAGNLFEEILAENFLSLGKETDSQVQKAECSKQNQPRGTTPNTL